MYTISSNEEFAEQYRKFMLEIADTLTNTIRKYSNVHFYKQSHNEVIQDIPTKNEIIDMIINHDTGTLRDELTEIKIHYNECYDKEDPDCAATIHKCEILLDYLK